MTRPLAWVLGAGGLLGRHVLEAMDSCASGPIPWRRGPSGIPWEDPARARQALDELASAFLREVEARACEWTVLWCAGAGVVGTGAEALASETAYLGHLLEVLGRKLPRQPGRILLASSAGAVYGASSGQPLTEYSPCQPISEYGRNKLTQEAMVLAWAQSTPTVSSLVARISNLYGPSQKIGKPQGLISHISRSIYHRTPIRIFVPLDTLRDYLYVEDAARMLLIALNRLGEGERVDILKVFHSGEATTIAGLMGIFSRLTRGRVRMICSSDAATAQQPLQLYFRSLVWHEMALPSPMTLPLGIQRVHEHMLEVLQCGALPPQL